MKTAPPTDTRPSTASRIGEIFVWAVLIVPPFLFVPAKESFRLPKLLASEWLGLASVLILAWGLRGSGAGISEAVRDAWRVPAVRALLPILLVATVGLWTTEHPLQVRDALFDLWIGAACLAGWSTGLWRDRQERLLRGLLWPASLLALLGVFQFFRIFEPLQLTGSRWDPRLGLTSLAGNPGDLGAYLVLPCLVAFWSFLSLRSPVRWHRWLTGIGLALCLYALALTQTLAALGALAAGLLVLAVLMLPRRRALAGLAAGAAVVMVLVLAVAPLRTRVAAKIGPLLSGDLNELLTGRLDGWRAAVWMLEERPVTGVGHGAYLPEYIPAKTALLEQGVEFLPGQTNPVFSNAHNEYLEAAAEWGIPGLLALAWGLWVLLGTARSVPERDRPLVWSGLAALAVLCLVYFPFRVALVAFPAILFLAWVLRPRALAGLEREEP